MENSPWPLKPILVLATLFALTACGGANPTEKGGTTDTDGDGYTDDVDLYITDGSRWTDEDSDSDGYTDDIDANPTDATVGLAIQDLLIYVNDSNQAELNWTDTDWEVTYEVQYRVSEDEDWLTLEAIAADTNTNIIDLNLRILLQSSFRVTSCTGSGDCYGSNIVTGSSLDSSELITYIKASNTNSDDFFGDQVSLSADGSTLAIAGLYEDSCSTGVDGDETSDSCEDSGAVYLFENSDNGWHQTAYLKASNTSSSDFFGASIFLSADGSTLAVGTGYEDSCSTGINGDETSDACSASGAVYLFENGDSGWSQTAYVKAFNTDSEDLFGQSVSLSADGATLAVGAFGEDSCDTGVNGDETFDLCGNSGAVYLFEQGDSGWSQTAYVKASNTENDNFFGWSVFLSANGSTLAVSALYEDSCSTGINADETSNSCVGSGAAYLFEQGDSGWGQTAYVKASNTGYLNFFGDSVALSANGSILAVGAYLEGSCSKGVNADEAPDSCPGSGAASGAVYLFEQGDSGWSQTAYVKASNTGDGDYFGQSVSLSADGSTLAVGADGEDSCSTGVDGIGWSNSCSNSGATYIY
ncbi:MAG: hypothetical protein ACPGYX_10150 [Oceanobacter sp.]